MHDIPGGFSGILVRKIKALPGAMGAELPHLVANEALELLGRWESTTCPSGCISPQVSSNESYPRKNRLKM